MSEGSTSGEVSEESSKLECSTPSNKPQPHTSAAAENLETTGDAALNHPDSSGSDSPVPPLTADQSTASTQSNASSEDGDGAVNKEELPSAAKSASGQGRSAQNKDSDQTGERKICFFYAKSGWCRYDQNCRFLHTKKKPSSTSQSEKPKSHGPDENEGPAATSEHGGSGGSATESGSNSAATQQTCRFFARAGWCRYGYRCKFAHVSKKSSPEADESDGVKSQSKNLKRRKDDVAEVTQATSDLHVDDKRKPKSTWSEQREAKDDHGSSVQPKTWSLLCQGLLSNGKEMQISS